MKKQGSFILFLMALFVISFAQVNAQSTNASLGIVPNYKVNGYGISVNFSYYHNPTDYFQLHLVAAFSKEQPTAAVQFPFKDYLANLGYFTTVLTSERRGISIFFGGGPAVGYEITEESRSESSIITQPANQVLFSELLLLLKWTFTLPTLCPWWSLPLASITTIVMLKKSSFF